MRSPKRIAASPAAVPPASHPAYRPDIDGLRAIAILGVILFHYGLAPVPGGFTGVDIFFVISGFLIVSIVRTEAAEQRFSFVGFYERRIRRILPALLVVLLVSGLAATRFLPNDMKTIGLGFINAATFTSNLYFASQAEDYFAAGSLASQPTLHTWSLAVEAQFYLVFPVLWIATRRWPGVRAAGFATLLALSFGASLWGVEHWPQAAFYVLPTRLWEFLIGGALVVLPWQNPRPNLAAVLTLVGLGLIGAGFVALTPTTPFPGAAALLPCLGTALVIGACPRGPDNPISRLLATPALVWPGRLSYSLYLWHWPVLVLAAYGEPTPLPLGERLGLLALTCLLSVASWRFIERPFIERRWFSAPRRLVMASLAGILLAGGLGLAINLAGQGFVILARFPPKVLALADGQFDRLEGSCRPDDLRAAFCHFGASPTNEPSVLLWGNSFARMWLPAIQASARQHGVSGTAMVLSRCPPLLDVALPEVRECDRFNHDVLAYVDRHPGLRTVILGGNWLAWMPDIAGLDAAIEALKARGRRVVVIASPPDAPYTVPRTLALAALRDRPPPPLVGIAAARARQSGPNDRIAAIARRDGLTVIDPFAALCDDHACAVERDGRSLYSDEAHISRFGAALFPHLFDPAFEPAMPTP